MAGGYPKTTGGGLESQTVSSTIPPLHAWDVYPHWKKAIACARESVTIFTPYLDSALTKLLRCLNPVMTPEKVRIITMKSGEVFLQNPKQLKTIKTLIDSKYLVSWIPCLHAKVLIVDDECLYLGSQNFTTQGTRNKEVSAGPVCPGQGKFMDHLKMWEKDSEPVDELLIDVLLCNLEKIPEQQKKLNQEAKAAFTDALVQYENEKMRIEIEAQEKETEKRRAELAEQERLRLEAELIGEERRRLEREQEELRNKTQRLAALSGYSRIQGTVANVPGKDYESLLFDGGYKATELKPGNSAANIVWPNLKRLGMHPGILVDSFRMAFVRLADTRITYVRFGVNWKWKWKTPYREFDVTIKFPARETFSRNIKAIFFYDDHQVCEADMLFDGADVKVVGIEFSQHPSIDYWRNFGKEVENSCFKKPAEIKRLLHSSLGAFKYAEFDLDRKNIRHLLRGTRYELGVIEFADIPIITMSAMR